MTLEDGWLLIKKIVIGIVITIVPLSILTAGLWLTRHMNDHPAKEPVSTPKAGTHAH
jgi:hypothetical protein